MATTKKKKKKPSTTKKPAVVRFAMAMEPREGAPIALELGAMFDAIGLELSPVFTPRYGTLYAMMRQNEVDAGWCPPLVAYDLLLAGDARIGACVARQGSIHYFSAIVGTAALRVPKDIRRMGWISRASSAGYVVPRAYLVSLGIDVAFEQELFLQTHERAMSALEAGVVDAIATYATRSSPGDKPQVPHAFPKAKVLATIGPIPGDVIMLSSKMHSARAERITAMLEGARPDPEGALVKAMGTTSFEPAPRGHLASLSQWMRGTITAKPRGNTDE
jgi:ABC-type phosphate/phosphonate transport system substrate-binding protein